MYPAGRSLGNSCMHKIFRKAHAFILGFILLAQGCGFNVRQTATLPAFLEPSEIEGGIRANWSLCLELRQQLENGGLSVTTEEAEYQLIVDEFKSDRRAFTIEQDASTAEYELIRSARYRLKRHGEIAPLRERIIVKRRVYRQIASALLAKDREQDTLQRELDERIAREIVNQLSLLTKPVHITDKGNEQITQ